MEINNNDYVELMAEFSDEFARAGYEGFRVYEITLGTPVLVTKHRSSVNAEADRYNQLLKGAMNIREDGMKQSTTSFETRLLLNKSQLAPKFMKSTEELQVTYTKDLFSIGDLISFDYLHYHYKLKVTQVESFGQQDNVIHRMTLQPYRETK